ncbi:MAG: hemerythrin domain-containing protein [Pseudomonadota bacterium]
MDDPLALDRRAGLPDALRILLEKFPRAEWEGHGNFNAMTRFWLDRHLMFRRALARLETSSQEFLDRELEAAAFGQEFARVGSFFLQELHTHHHVEDAHYFPRLAAHEPRLARGFEILDADHHALEAALGGFAEDANALLARLDDPAAAREATGPVEARLATLHRFLDRHLTDEEEIVVPLVLEHAPAEFE